MRVYLCAVLALASTTGCVSLGYNYRHLGKKHMMTKENADYHKRTIDEINMQFGVLVGTLIETPDLQATESTLADLKVRLTEQIDRYDSACKALKLAVSGSPDGEGFTSAGRLLELDAQKVCGEASNGRSSVDRIAQTLASRTVENEKNVNIRQAAVQQFYSRQLNRGANGAESAEASAVVCQGEWAKDHPNLSTLETAEVSRCAELRQGLQR
jgi:hypothetical protein